MSEPCELCGSPLPNAVGAGVYCNTCGEPVRTQPKQIDPPQGDQARLRAFIAGEQVSSTAVERVARLICRLEFQAAPVGVTEEAQWTRFMDAYRDRAKIVLLRPDGWQALGR